MKGRHLARRRSTNEITHDKQVQDTNFVEALLTDLGNGKKKLMREALKNQVTIEVHQPHHHHRGIVHDIPKRLTVKSVFDHYCRGYLPPGQTFAYIEKKGQVMDLKHFNDFMKDFGLFPGCFSSREEVNILFRKLNLMSRKNESRLELSRSQFEHFIQGVLTLKGPAHQRGMSSEDALNNWRRQKLSGDQSHWMELAALTEETNADLMPAIEEREDESDPGLEEPEDTADLPPVPGPDPDQLLSVIALLRQELEQRSALLWGALQMGLVVPDQDKSDCWPDQVTSDSSSLIVNISEEVVKGRESYQAMIDTLIDTRNTHETDLNQMTNTITDHHLSIIELIHSLNTARVIKWTQQQTIIELQDKIQSLSVDIGKCYNHESVEVENRNQLERSKRELSDQIVNMECELSNNREMLSDLMGELERKERDVIGIEKTYHDQILDMEMNLAKLKEQKRNRDMEIAALHEGLDMEQAAKGRVEREMDMVKSIAKTRQAEYEHNEKRRIEEIIWVTMMAKEWQTTLIDIMDERCQSEVDWKERMRSEQHVKDRDQCSAIVMAYERLETIVHEQTMAMSDRQRVAEEQRAAVEERHRQDGKLIRQMEETALEYKHHIQTLQAAETVQASRLQQEIQAREIIQVELIRSMASAKTWESTKSILQSELERSDDRFRRKESEVESLREKCHQAELANMNMRLTLGNIKVMAEIKN